jgi:hypothetical protein
VVAAGAKAILDLPKTLEVLETLGVPVIAFGQDAFPAFWSRDSGLKAPLRMDSPDEIAAAHRMRAALGLSGGQLVANPIPEAAEIPRAEILPRLIEAALAEAEAQGIAARRSRPSCSTASSRSPRAARWRPTSRWSRTTPASAPPSPGRLRFDFTIYFISIIFMALRNLRTRPFAGFPTH